MFTGLLTGISGFLTQMFQLIGSLFNGVVALFWNAPTTQEGTGSPTVLLEVIIFSAAASLVGVAIYVIVRLIRGAVARLRSGVSSAK